MFCLINKAWVDILARRIKNKEIEKVLCVYTTWREGQIVFDVVKKYNIEWNMLVIPEKEIEELLKQKILELIIFDDILISPNIHNIFVKDYLAKHCKRINKILE